MKHTAHSRKTFERATDRAVIDEYMADHVEDRMEDDALFAMSREAFVSLLESSTTDEVIDRIDRMGGIANDAELRTIFDAYLFQKLLDGDVVGVNTFLEKLHYTCTFLLKRSEISLRLFLHSLIMLIILMFLSR